MDALLVGGTGLVIGVLLGLAVGYVLGSRGGVTGSGTATGTFGAQVPRDASADIPLANVVVSQQSVGVDLRDATRQRIVVNGETYDRVEDIPDPDTRRMVQGLTKAGGLGGLAAVASGMTPEQVADAAARLLDADPTNDPTFEPPDDAPAARP